jgi:hypothetical protein
MCWLEIQLLHKINQSDNREVAAQKKACPNWDRPVTKTAPSAHHRGR